MSHAPHLTLLKRADALIRGRWMLSPDESRRQQFAQLALLIIIFGMIYGGVMGSSQGLLGHRFYQVVFSAVKVPMLLAATFLLSLPSFFVFNTLFGLRRDLPRAVAAVIATQAVLTLILASLAPLTAFWYVSVASYRSAVLFNAAMFAIASLAAQWPLRNYYRPLIERDRRHVWMLRIWIVTYSFVGSQMAWVLRPFIGNPNITPTFFRPEAWGNAYVNLARPIWKAVSF